MTKTATKTAPKTGTLSGLSNDQKRTLATAVIAHVATLAEFPETSPGLSGLLEDGVDFDAAMQVVANWMDALPGTAWDTRLPDPAHRTNARRTA